MNKIHPSNSTEEGVSQPPHIPDQSSPVMPSHHLITIEPGATAASPSAMDLPTVPLARSESDAAVPLEELPPVTHSPAIHHPHHSIAFNSPEENSQKTHAGEIHSPSQGNHLSPKTGGIAQKAEAFTRGAATMLKRFAGTEPSADARVSPAPQTRHADSIEITQLKRTDSHSRSVSSMRPHFGRLESRSESESAAGVIAEFAKGNKSLSVVVRQDLKNRWLVSFSWEIFTEFFLIHMFGPFAVPYMHYRYGPYLWRNMALGDIKPPTGVGTIMWAMWVAMNALYWSGGSHVSHIPLSEVILATCIFLARNSIIAAKYAYFSPAQLSDACKRMLTPEEQASSLIVAGWYVPSVKTIRSELEYALKRTHVDLKHMYFSFSAEDKEEKIAIAKKLHASFDELMDEKNRCERWQDVWSEKLEQGEVPGTFVITTLLTEAVKEHSGRNYLKRAFQIAILHALIPTIIRVSINPPEIMGSSAQEVVIIISAFAISILNVFANLMFVLVGVVDYDRRVQLMHQCSAMLTAQYKIWQTGKSALMPILNFEKPSNIANWLDMRLVLKDWGLQYFKRIQTYASLWVCFVVGFVVFLFASLALDSIEITTVTLVCFDLIVLLVAMLMMVDSAKTLNSQTQDHRRILLHKLNNLQRQISKATVVDSRGLPLNLGKERLFELTQAKDMMTTAMMVLEHEDRVAPIRILGFDANDNFLRGMLGFSLSAIIAAGKLILGGSLKM